jgi:hypothetical protein
MDWGRRRRKDCAEGAPAAARRNLGNNTFGGTLPSELGALTALRRLRVPLCEVPWLREAAAGGLCSEAVQAAAARRIVDNNLFDGTLPSELGAIAALTMLWVPVPEVPWTEGGGGGRTVLRAQALAAARRNLPNNQLSGTLPSELGALTALGMLWVPLCEVPWTEGGGGGRGGLCWERFSRRRRRRNLLNNQLSGTLPSELGALTALKRLQVPLCELPWLREAAAGGLCSEAVQAAAARRIVDNNLFDGTLPSELGAIAALTMLWVPVPEVPWSKGAAAGGLCSEAVQAVAAARRAVANSQFDGTLPSELGALTALKELWVPLCELPWLREAAAEGLCWGRSGGGGTQELEQQHV